MSIHLDRYVGPQKAAELISISNSVPKIPKSGIILHEIYLTSILHSLVQAAKKEQIPVMPIGGLGTSPHYLGNHSKRRFVGNIDVEIPKEIALEKIERVFSNAGLKTPAPVEDVYLANSLLSSNTVDGRKVDIFITRLTPWGLFKRFSKVIPYSNHVIEAYSLPAFSFPQMTLEAQVASKALALADPNRSVTKGKMDDLHDLIHISPRASDNEIDRVLTAGFFGQMNGKKQVFKSNLATILKILEGEYSSYQKWLRENLFNPHVTVTESEWKSGISRLGKKLGARGYSPLTAIRTKIQLADRDKVLRLAKLIDPEKNSEEKSLRLGLFAREIEPLIITSDFTDLDDLSKRSPNDLVSELLKRFK